MWMKMNYGKEKIQIEFKRRRDESWFSEVQEIKRLQSESV